MMLNVLLNECLVTLIRNGAHFVWYMEILVNFVGHVHGHSVTYSSIAQECYAM